MQEIFCEHYEDILIRKPATKWIGVQVKTREPHLGPFKSDEGPVLHAIERFVLLDLDFPSQFEAFVLVANCDFWRAAETAKNLNYVINFLREKPRANLPKPINILVSKLRERCKCRKDEVISTMAKIRLDGRVPKFEDITAAVACRIGAIPEFRDRMFPELMSAASALINAVLERSALTCNQSIRTHIVFSSDPEDEKVRQTISQKRVTPDLVLTVIKQSLSSAVELRTATPATLASEPFGHHILEEKMAAGGISFLSIDAAKDQLRSAEYLLQQWLHKMGPEAATLRYEQLTVIVKSICSESCDSHYSDVVLFGQPMLNDVRQRLRTAVASDPGVFDVRYEHLLGVASIATEDCTVWWSKPFQISRGEQ
jgi:hypothetical protein